MFLQLAHTTVAPLAQAGQENPYFLGQDARIALYWDPSYIGVSSGTAKLETKDSKPLHVLKLM